MRVGGSGHVELGGADAVKEHPPLIRREDQRGSLAVLGLMIVAALTADWGCSAADTGKVVWAALDAEDGG